MTTMMTTTTTMMLLQTSMLMRARLMKRLLAVAVAVADEEMDAERAEGQMLGP